MLVSALIPQPEERVSFSLAAVLQVSEDSGCYVITAHNGTILYIGQAVNISRRMEDHRKDPEKNGQTPHGVAFWFYYLPCPKNELDDLERGWMNEHLLQEGELPFFNKIKPPV